MPEGAFNGQAVSRQTLLSLGEGRPFERVELPGGMAVRVQAMSSAERDRFELEQAALNRSRSGMDNFRARFLLYCLADDDGNRLLGDGDAEALGQLPASVVRPLFDAAQRLNTIDAGEVSELVEDFESPQDSA